MLTYSCRLTLIFNEKVLLGGLWFGSSAGFLAILKLMNLDKHTVVHWSTYACPINNNNYRRHDV